MTFRYLQAALPVAVLIIAFTIAMPAGAGWHNDSEFILSAYYLDVAHPPGFPLLSQISNLFTLLPLGPIAWRVHSASLVICCLVLILSYRLTFYFLKQLLKIDSAILPYFAILPSLLLSASPTFLKQAFSADSYALHCLTLQILLLLYLRAMQTKDLRYLISAAFLAGIFPGNHLAIIISYPPAVLLVVLRLKTYRKILLPSLLLSLLGLGVFAYVPVRSESLLPLSSGSNTDPIHTLSSINEDRRLDSSAEVVHTIYSKNQIDEQKEWLASLLIRLNTDLEILHREIPYLVLITACIGLVVVLVQRTDFGVLIGWSMLSHWFLFRGWQPDTWIPIYFLIGFLATCVLALLCQILADLSTKKLTYTATLFAGMLLLALTTRQSILQARYAETNSVSKEFTRQQLLEIPENALLISERSYFLHAYTHYIEGYRSDLSVLSLTKITETAHNNPFLLTLNNSAVVDEKQLSQSATGNLKLIIDRILPNATVAFEPTAEFAKYLVPVTKLSSRGLGYISYQQQGTFSDDVPLQSAILLAKSGNQIANSWPPLQWEGFQEIAAKATAIGATLSAHGEHAMAVDFYSSLCARMSCTPALKNGLAGALILNEQLDQAAALLELLVSQDISSTDRQAALRNLSIVYSIQEQGSNLFGPE